MGKLKLDLLSDLYLVWFSRSKNIKIHNFTFNYLQLLYREVKGILLYQGFPRPIFSTKHPERSEGCFVDKIGRGNLWLSKNFSFP